MNEINRSESCNINQCDLSTGIDQLKSRWMGGVILSLHESDKRFSSLENNFPFMTSGQLNRTLRQAIDNRLIEKKELAYTLTAKGQAAAQLYMAIEQWVMTFDAQP
ncbi:winged helix-turn-helix transcriptional regulator [Hydromonas duriensis]|uniref:HxlR family transcriptional regulator n=1 Tax=Hydromonas duriensis TaxID=1527608 RepID=A0A4R6YAB5_9BURK|nr:winged helix-turn-helix transcriptional regulator [Hydromonas duriensis]TDR32497.1 HxlR family transcriptional regulator [Hydromonas duriensis]